MPGWDHGRRKLAYSDCDRGLQSGMAQSTRPAIRIGEMRVQQANQQNTSQKDDQNTPGQGALRAAAQSTTGCCDHCLWKIPC